MAKCDNCLEKFECYTPCKDVIEWQDLQKEDYQPSGSYVGKGVPLYTKSGAQYRKEKASKGGRA